MMKYIFLSLFFTLACSSNGEKEESRSVVMNSLWKSKATKQEIIKKLGNEYNDLGYALVYPTKWESSVKSVHWFKDDVLNEQIIHLDEKSLEQMKLDIPCPWEESEKKEGHGHTVYLVKRGKCVQNNIEYNYKPGNAYYEVRWKK